MIQWNSKELTEKDWANSNNQILVLGLLDSPDYDPLDKPYLIALSKFGRVSESLALGFGDVPRLAGSYDLTANYPLAHVSLGKYTNGDFKDIRELMAPIHKVIVWAEVSIEDMEDLEWQPVDWNKAKDDTGFFPDHTGDDILIGRGEGGIILNLDVYDNGYKWWYGTTAGVARVYGIESQTSYKEGSIDAIHVMKRPKSTRVQFVF